MYDFKTILEALALDTTLGEAFGPFATIAFIGLAATLVGVTLGVMVRGVLEQVRGPEYRARAAALAYGLGSDPEPEPAPASAG